MSADKRCSQAFLPDQVSYIYSKAVQREAHDIEVVSLYALDKDAGCSLDAISSSFPIALTCVQIECLHTYVFGQSLTAACNEVLHVLTEQHSSQGNMQQQQKNAEAGLLLWFRQDIEAIKCVNFADRPSVYLWLCMLQSPALIIR